MNRSRLPVRRLLAIARPVKSWLALSLLCRLGGTACAIALLAVPAVLLTSGGLTAATVVATAVVLALLAGAKAALRYAEQFTGHRAAFELLADMRVRLYDAVLPQAPAVVARTGAGRIASVATRDVDRIEVFFAHTIVPVAAAVVVPVAGAAVVAVAAGPAAAAIVACGFLVGGVVVPFLGAGRARAASLRLLSARAALAQHVTEDVEALAEIRSFGAERRRLEEMRSHEDGIAAALRMAGSGAGVRAGIGIAWPVVTLAALIPTAAGDIAGLLLAAAIVVSTAPTLASVEALGRSLPHALSAARRYLALLDRRPDVEDDVAAADATGHGAAGLELEGVTARHPGSETDVLTAVTLSVPPGGALAVTGPSGSGKSTLAALLVRTLDPVAGVVRIDGRDIRDIPLAHLRRRVALVEQRTVLFAGTVLDNLRLGSPSLSEDEAWRALETAGLEDDIRALPDGLHAPIGIDGSRLSGGQRQRLGLARAIARRPGLLVLDEATSHQDPVTQAAVRRALGRLEDCTVIVIAHREDAIAGISERIALGTEGSG